MADWSELERVERDGSYVVETVNGHRLVKVYRLDDNGSRRKDRKNFNLGVDESIPKEERKHNTAWKCELCGLEFGGGPTQAEHSECDPNR